MKKEEILVMDDRVKSFLVSFLQSKTDVRSAFFDLTSNNCFTYLMKELCNYEKNWLDGNIKNNYIQKFSSFFYDFLEKDEILVKVNSLVYAILLEELKSLSEGNKCINKEQYSYLLEVTNKNSHYYFQEVANQIKSFNYVEEKDLHSLNRLCNLFLNETLARGIDPRFIRMILMSNNERFKNGDEIIDYFFYQNSDSYTIYIPIKNINQKDMILFEKKQIIEEKEGHYYAKVYKNKCIDFFSTIKEQMTRIDSIFNILKIYSNTSINFDFEQEIIVEITNDYEFNNSRINFNEIRKYKGYTPYSKHLDAMISNLEVLNSKEKSNYHKILNIISYAEKDDDILSSTSYIDNWIALESLYSLSKRKEGYQSVSEYLPSIVASKYIKNQLTNSLQICFKNEEKISSEDFIKKVISGTFEEKIKTIDDIYYKYRIRKLASFYKDFKSFRFYYQKIENRISIDLLRIYMLRNEFVHQSNLNAFYSLQYFKLKNFLAISLDEFFKMLSQKIESSYLSPFGLTYDAFSKLINKENNKKMLLMFLSEKRKTKSEKRELSIIEIPDKISIEEVMVNLYLDNNVLLKKYSIDSEYKKR